MGPGVELLTAVMGYYQQFTGRQLSAGRVMAWHLRNALGDALWSSEAGILLPDHRTTTRVGRGPGRAASAHSASTPTHHPLLTRADAEMTSDLTVGHHLGMMAVPAAGPTSSLPIASMP